MQQTNFRSRYSVGLKHLRTSNNWNRCYFMILSICLTCISLTLAQSLPATDRPVFYPPLPPLSAGYKVNQVAIADCVKNRIETGKRYRKKNEYKEFHLDYGDAALETFHSLSLDDMKRIDYLEECVRMYEKTALYLDRSTADYVESREFVHGGSNVTYLTGLLQTILPDIHQTIKTSAQKAMSESYLTNMRSKSTKKEHGRNWEVELASLGVRSVQYTSYLNIQAELTSIEKRRLRLEQRKKIAAKMQAQKEYERKTYGAELTAPRQTIGRNVFSKENIKAEEEKVKQLEMEEQARREAGVALVADPHADDVDWAAIEYEYDPLADDHLKDYLHSDGATVYTIIILLNDRQQFHGGEVFIRKDKSGLHGFIGAGIDSTAAIAANSGVTAGSVYNNHAKAEEDGYDEEEEFDVGFVGDQSIHALEAVPGDETIMTTFQGGGQRVQRKKSIKEMRRIALDKASDAHFNAEYGRANKKQADRKTQEVLQAHPHYNAFHTRISRYTPDRGNLLIVRSDYEHGIQPLFNGRRNALVIEYWAYEDATVEERRPRSEREGRLQPRRWQEL